MNHYHYIYKGPVMLFDKCVADNYHAETYATSEKKARNNIAFQYKRRANLAPRSKVTCPGKIELAKYRKENQHER